jgi:hypothetical protein
LNRVFKKQILTQSRKRRGSFGGGSWTIFSFARIKNAPSLAVRNLSLTNKPDFNAEK